jgi:hypothetical protein
MLPCFNLAIVTSGAICQMAASSAYVKLFRSALSSLDLVERLSLPLAYGAGGT